MTDKKATVMTAAAFMLQGRAEAGVQAGATSTAAAGR